MIRKFIGAAAIAVLALLTTAPSAQATVLTFDNTSGEYQFHDSPYDESGYRLEGVNNGFWLSPGGTIYLYQGGDTGILSQIAGGAFNLESIHLTSDSSFDTTFTGYLADGGTVSTHLTGGTDGGVIAFLGFTNVTHVSWVNGGVHLDDVTVTPGSVPEPTSMALLGLGGLALARARRRKA